jgi:hypothetical protein
MTSAQPAGPVLLANLGAEEGEGVRSRAATAVARRVASLWALLFGSSAASAEGIPAASWPTAWGARPVQPAFDWLSQQPGLVPWLSTEGSASEARRRGLSHHAPDPAIVRSVDDKAFATSLARDEGLLPSELASQLQVFEPDELMGDGIHEALTRALAGWPEARRRSWILKPRHGSSGRGRWLSTGDALPPPATLARLARRGGAVLEPWLDRVWDASVQLHVTRGGAVTVLGVTKQLLTEQGLVLGNCGELRQDGSSTFGGELDERLVHAATVVTQAAAATGFHGPCGVDSFAYREDGGAESVRPVVELNARCTTGTISLGLLRRAIELGGVPRAHRWSFRSETDEPDAATEEVRFELPDGGAAALSFER